MFSRYSVQPVDKRAKFCPIGLSDANAAEMNQKRAAVGAAFLGKLSKLAGSPCVQVVSELDLCPDMYRPVKPKLWLVGELKMERGHYYKLTH